MFLAQIIPDPQTVLDLPIEKLAYKLLKLAKTNHQNNMMNFSDVTGGDRLFEGYGHPQYSNEHREKIENALGEAWHWLEIVMMIMPAIGANGNSGWKVITRKGEQLLTQDEQAFDAYISATKFPKSLLHPKIADRVWDQLALGDFETAVFIAFKQVEVEVRKASSLAPDTVGIDLMRKAFNADSGKLRNPEALKAEQNALADLFSGAIGRYKNPASHRKVLHDNEEEAHEILVFASHLLRIVDGIVGTQEA